MKHLISSRRRIIQSFTSLTLYFGLGSAAIFTNRKLVAQAIPTPSCGSKTPAQLEGPFFTTNLPERSNLTNANGRAQKITVFGEVLDQFCQPVSGAMLDFWQSDERGVYDNRRDRLRGHQFLNIKGNFSLLSLMPGVYTGRAPHLHVKVQRKNGPVLTTQLYFPNHPRNRQDFFLNSAWFWMCGNWDFFINLFCPLKKLTYTIN